MKHKVKNVEDLSIIQEMREGKCINSEANQEACCTVQRLRLASPKELPAERKIKVRRSVQK